MILALITTNLIVAILTFFARMFHMNLVEDPNQYCEKINNFYVVLLCLIPVLNLYFLCCFIYKIFVICPDNFEKKIDKNFVTLFITTILKKGI